MRPDTAPSAAPWPRTATAASRPGRGPAPDRGPGRVRRRRRGQRRHGHHPGRRRGPPRRPHDRPLARRRAARTASTTGCRSWTRRPVLARQTAYTPPPRHAGRHARSSPAPADFREVEAPLTEDEARDGAVRCIDCAVCSGCNECVNGLPVDDCIDLHARDEIVRGRGRRGRRVDRLQAVRRRPKPEYGFGRFKNVITGTQMDRLLAPTRPFNTILRPGDGKVPERIAYILCTGLARRDRRQPALLAVLLHVLDQAEPAAHGRPAAGRRDRPLHGHPGPGQALRRVLRAGQGHGRDLRQGPRRRRHRDSPTGDLVLRYEDIENGGALVEAEYDMVVLAVGVQPNRDVEQLFEVGELAARRMAATSRSRTRTSTRARPASRACSWPAPPRAPRTSPTRSSTRARRSRRSPPTSKRDEGRLPRDATMVPA